MSVTDHSPVQSLLELLALPGASEAEMTTQLDALLEAKDWTMTSEFTSRLERTCSENLQVLIHQTVTSVKELLDELRYEPDAGTAVLQFTGEALSSGGTRSLLAERLAMLAAMMVQSKIQIGNEVISVFIEGVESKNRFVRTEALKGLTRVLGQWKSDKGGDVGKELIQAIAKGLDDQWNQVRYSAGRLCRVVVEKKLYRGYLELLVPRMLLNRHYNAEGIQVFDQETWKIFVTNEAPNEAMIAVTGKEFAKKYLVDIVGYLRPLVPEFSHEHCEDGAHNHGAADERASAAALLLVNELLQKVVCKNDEGIFSVQLCRVTMEMVLGGITSSAWSVRSVALQVLSPVLRSCAEIYPTVVKSFEADIADELKASVTDQIPGIRKDAAFVANELADILGGKTLWREFARGLVEEGLASAAGLGETDEPVNRPMFSCCSFGGAKRKPGSPTERADGGVRLLCALGLEKPDHEVLLRLKEVRPQMTKVIDEVMKQLAQ